MSKPKLAYVQLHTGELAVTEQRAVIRVIGQYCNIDFVTTQRVLDCDLRHDYDHIIFGDAPWSWPQAEDPVTQALDKCISTKMPLLAIGYSHLILANLQQFSVTPQSKRNLELSKYRVKSPDCELSPEFVRAKDEEISREFYALANHSHTISEGEISKVFIGSENSEYAGIAYNSRTYSTECVPFITSQSYPWWIMPYPDLWKNILGFWYFPGWRGNGLLGKFGDWYRYNRQMTESEQQQWDEIQAQLEHRQIQFSYANDILTNFVTKIKK